MKSSTVANTQLPVDEARRKLGAHFAKTLRGGSFRVRVRLHRPLGAAWFYEHRDNTWHKQDVTLSDPALVQAVTDELALLASKPHGDVLQVQVHDAADWHETELQFDRNVIEQHLNDQLESYLAGLLFHDPHDSKQDVRRHVQPGPRHSGHKH